ncbi:hypothetical protein PF008_g154 [Phytophthora fragariae]|uniref:Uncharacterized protein n=1 Tax=Phytophthora fragariae TaxID=53985 RepID=A0A6G0SPH0_9STRA|nr:hypothetical protein PF008_g154 [Phytophthora fragariae]
MDDLPSCFTTVRFIQAIWDGDAKEEDVLALETNRHLSGMYRNLRSCDSRFNAMRERGDAEDAGVDPVTLPVASQLYAEFITCAGGALCEKATTAWTTCVESVQTQNKSIRDCDHVKKLMERCMSSKTEDLLKGLQPQIYRPSAAP